jgi:hypothetical protein
VARTAISYGQVVNWAAFGDQRLRSYIRGPQTKQDISAGLDKLEFQKFVLEVRPRDGMSMTVR